MSTPGWKALSALAGRWDKRGTGRAGEGLELAGPGKALAPFIENHLTRS